MRFDDINSLQHFVENITSPTVDLKPLQLLLQRITTVPFVSIITWKSLHTTRSMITFGGSSKVGTLVSWYFYIVTIGRLCHNRFGNKCMQWDKRGR